jgi:formate dehydrogenase maturation protein FdhE
MLDVPELMDELDRRGLVLELHADRLRIVGNVRTIDPVLALQLRWHHTELRAIALARRGNGDLAVCDTCGGWTIASLKVSRATPDGRRRARCPVCPTSNDTAR